MKKFNKILTLSLASLLLFACDDIAAEPSPVVNGDNLIQINGNSDFYKNDFEALLESLNSSGSSSNTIMTKIINNISKDVVSKFYNITIEEFNAVLENVKDTLANKPTIELTNENAKTLKEIIIDEVKDTMISKVNTGSYSVDNLFNETKLVNELKSSLYKIEGSTLNKDYLITPDSTYEEIFKADYSDYIERNIYPDILQNLLTSVYLFENNYTSLGRAYGRDVKYIKLETISTHKDSVPVLINSYFTSFLNDSLPTENFDLNSLARIYKGVYNLDTPDQVEQNEIQFIETSGITTRQDVVDEELTKVGTFDSETNEYIIHTDTSKLDTNLLSTYTGSYTYPVSYGKELKDRELATLDIVVDDGIAISDGGVSDLPTDIRSRIFNTNIKNNIQTLTSRQNKTINVLTPKNTPNTSEGDTDYYLNKFAHYDSSTSAYYIVLVDSYYSIDLLKSGNPDLYNKKDDEAKIEFSQETKDAALEIARLLSTKTSNQKKAIIHYLEEYGMTFGDQSFYDYIESTYPDVLEDD